MNNDNQSEDYTDAYVDGLAAKMRRARRWAEALRVAKRGLRIVENIIVYGVVVGFCVMIWIAIWQIIIK